MSTLLQEILTEQEVQKMPPGDIVKIHKGGCSCLQCTHGVANPSHKNWRQRRNARYYKPEHDCKSSVQQEIEEPAPGPVLGNRQLAGLLSYWGEKIKKAKSDVMKARYQKCIDIINKSSRLKANS